MKCKRCGCTDWDCRRCIERTGDQCWWIKTGVCSACATLDELLVMFIANSAEYVLGNYSRRMIARREIIRRLNEWEATR